MLNKNSGFNDENTDPASKLTTQRYLTHSISNDMVYMNALQTFFYELDDINKRLSFFMLAKSKIYACYIWKTRNCVLKIVDNSTLNEFNTSAPELYIKKLKMSYICDHAFRDHIAVLLEADSNLDEKYCLQVYNNELDLIAEKYFAYQVNPVYMNESELFCISMQAPSLLCFDFNLNSKDLFKTNLKLCNPEAYACFKHRAFWICGATDDHLYVDNRNFGFDIVCRKTGFILRTIKGPMRSKLPCARIDSQSNIIMINDKEKTALTFDKNGNFCMENSLEKIQSSLADHFIHSTHDDDFYLFKQSDEITEFNFFKTKQM